MRCLIPNCQEERLFHPRNKSKYCERHSSEVKLDRSSEYFVSKDSNKLNAEKMVSSWYIPNKTVKTKIEEFIVKNDPKQSQVVGNGAIGVLKPAKTFEEYKKICDRSEIRSKLTN